MLINQRVWIHIQPRTTKECSKFQQTLKKDQEDIDSEHITSSLKIFSNSLQISYFINFFIKQVYKFCGYVKTLSELRLKGTMEIQQIFKEKLMPKTQHLDSLTSNRIYALDAQVLYKHHCVKNTTAIIQQDKVQSKLKIPNHILNAQDHQQLIQGSKYHFGFCYISPNGWINVRNPESSIKQNNGMNQESTVTIFKLSELVQLCENLNGHYLTTYLYVISINPVQKIKKGNKQLTLCILKCFSQGHLIDVTLWNFDLPLQNLIDQWIVFSGFRMKKLFNQKFIFVSSVYSKITKYNGPIHSEAYNPTFQYNNLSIVYEKKSIAQINGQIKQKKNICSHLFAMLKKIDCFTYQGCSMCKKKIRPGYKCYCDPQSSVKIYTVFKLWLQDEGERIQTSVFDEEIQNLLTELKEPVRIEAKIKSSIKVFQQHNYNTCHIVTKIKIL